MPQKRIYTPKAALMILLIGLTAALCVWLLLRTRPRGGQETVTIVAEGQGDTTDADVNKPAQETRKARWSSAPPNRQDKQSAIEKRDEFIVTDRAGLSRFIEQCIIESDRNANGAFPPHEERLYTYHSMRKRIPEKMLPDLHAMLSDQTYQKEWVFIAYAIGYISNNVASVPVLIDYYERNDYDTLKKHLYRHRLGLILCLGMIGGAEAEAYLRNLATSEGAKAFVEKNVPVSTAFKRACNKNNIDILVRNAALTGLVFLQTPEANALVKQIYDESMDNLYSKGIHDGISGYACLRMGEIDYIAEHGFDAYMKLNEDVDRWLEVIGVYRERHRPEDYWEIVRRIEKEAWEKEQSRAREESEKPERTGQDGGR